MKLKIENNASRQIAPRTLKLIEDILESVPWEHGKGLARLRIVDSITPDPRLRAASELPGLYHPKQGNSQAWIEIAWDKLQPKRVPFFKRFAARMVLRNQIIALLFQLIGQHYFLTLRHSTKRGKQFEDLVRDYTEKRFKAFAEQNQTWRGHLFKPLQPKIEAWAKSLQRKAAQAEKKTR